MVRRKRNRIESLVNDQGVRVEDANELKELALDFYKNLITVDTTVEGEFLKGYFPTMNEAVHERLSADFTIEDTKKAVIGLGSLKAPWPDGFHALFFKETWELTGQPLHKFAHDII